jgi:hypothetical protein
MNTAFAAVAKARAYCSILQRRAVRMKAPAHCRRALLRICVASNASTDRTSRHGYQRSGGTREIIAARNASGRSALSKNPFTTRRYVVAHSMTSRSDVPGAESPNT